MRGPPLVGERGAGAVPLFPSRLGAEGWGARGPGRRLDMYGTRFTYTSINKHWVLGHWHRHLITQTPDTGGVRVRPVLPRFPRTGGWGWGRGSESGPGPRRSGEPKREKIYSFI